MCIVCAQEKYGFKAHVFQAAGFTNVAEFKKEHGSDLFIRDIEEYDRICKVRPVHGHLSQASKLTRCDVRDVHMGAMQTIYTF